MKNFNICPFVDTISEYQVDDGSYKFLNSKHSLTATKFDGTSCILYMAQDSQWQLPSLLTTFNRSRRYTLSMIVTKLSDNLLVPSSTRYWLTVTKLFDITRDWQDRQRHLQIGSLSDWKINWKKAVSSEDYKRIRIEASVRFDETWVASAMRIESI